MIHHFPRESAKMLTGASSRNPRKRQLFCSCWTQNGVLLPNQPRRDDDVGRRSERASPFLSRGTAPRCAALMKRGWEREGRRKRGDVAAAGWRRMAAAGPAFTAKNLIIPFSTDSQTFFQRRRRWPPSALATDSCNFSGCRSDGRRTEDEGWNNGDAVCKCGAAVERWSDSFPHC